MNARARTWTRVDVVLTLLAAALAVYFLVIAVGSGRLRSYLAAAVLIAVACGRLYTLIRQRLTASNPARLSNADYSARPDGVFLKGRYVTTGLAETDAQSRGTGWMSISRLPFTTRDIRRNYRILIDGEPAGRVRIGQTLVVEVQAGTHTAQAKIDWTGSGVVSVAVEPGSTVELLAEPSGTSTANMLQMFSRHGYIALRQDDS